MVLSDVDLKAAIEAGEIEVSPAPDYETQLGACSLDMRLGNEFRVFERGRTAFIDPREEINWDSFSRLETVQDGERFIMHPQELVLASTIEHITLAPHILDDWKAARHSDDWELSCTAPRRFSSPDFPVAP